MRAEWMHSFLIATISGWRNPITFINHFTMSSAKLLTLLLAGSLFICPAQAQTYDDPAEAEKDPDFQIQGEYLRQRDNLGLQIVALGDGEFRLIFFTGGLPGAGWNGQEKREIEADREEAQDFLEDFEKVVRKSPTLGLKAPGDAVVLFDGSAETFAAHWQQPPSKITDDGLLMHGARSIDRFSDYTMHLEFRTPYMPKARGQGRGNSGVYHQGRHEVQVLDSFGLAGLQNECGGIYGVSAPSVNMCLPPLSWQTYDFEFVAARFEDGKKISPARLTVRLNGVVVQRDVELPKLAAGSPLPDDGSPGYLFLQDHGNPVQFRNIWVQPQDFSAVARRPIVPAFERFHTGPDADLTAGGKLLLAELNCTSCHTAQSDFVKALKPKQAPILTNVAKRIYADWMVDFIANPHAVKPGTTMPDILHGMTAEERRDAALSLTTFLIREATPEVGGSSDNLPNGLQLFQEVGCVACHQSQDDSVRLNTATSVPLPDLSKKYSFAGLDRFLKDPFSVRPSGRMPHVVLDDKERQSIVRHFVGGDTFSWSDQGSRPAKPNLSFNVYHGDWDRMPDFDKLEPQKSGTVAGFSIAVAGRTDSFGIRYDGYLPITTAGSYTFKTNSDDGSFLYVNDVRIVDNDGIHPGQDRQGSVQLDMGLHRIRVEYFEKGGGEHVKVFWTGPGVSGRRLDADLVLNPEQVPLTIQQQLAGEAPETEPATEDSDTYVYDAGRVAKGRELFQSLGCANCHEHKPDGKIVASNLQAPPLSECEFAGGCLSADTSKKTRGVPEFDLTVPQRTALASVIGEAASPEMTAEQTLVHSFATFNCYGCHERDGIGGPESDRNPMFQSTIPEMGDEGRLPPLLTGAGDKLKESYLQHIFANGANERPYMKVRMPKFGRKGTEHLIAIMRSQDEKTEAKIVTLEDSDKRVGSIGRKLVGDKGLSCVKCHTFDKFKATGIQAIAMDRMATRLREDWFHRYLVDPVKYRPGTRMPTAFPNGKSVATEIYDGDPARQLSAIWTWLKLGKEGGVPSGVAGGLIELTPEKEPIIYRNFLEGLSSRGIAVGYPEEAHLAWDADRMSLAKIWQGRFIDASMHWQGRGQGRQRPLGDNIVSWENTVPVAVLSEPSEKWPTAEPRERGYRFSGYRLDDKMRPAFRYRTRDFKVIDRPIPVSSDDFPSFKRDIQVLAEGDGRLSEQPKGVLYFRAASAQQITAADDGWWQTDRDVRVRITGGNVERREIDGHVELLVPVEPGAQITQEIVW